MGSFLPIPAHATSTIHLMSKAKRCNIDVQGAAITVVSQATGDFISLTGMAKKFGDDALIYS